MKINCQVAQDLLPLYLDEVCSNESRRLVEDHLRDCEKCRKLVSSAQAVPVYNVEPDTDAADQAVKQSFRKIRSRWIISVILAVAVISAVFIGWGHYESSQQTKQPEYEIAMAIMELLKDGDYEKAFSYMDTDRIREDWLQAWFEESELADFERRALSVFLQYAQKIEALGGIQEYEYIGITSIDYQTDGTPIYRLTFRILFGGEVRTLDLYISGDNIDYMMGDGTMTDPLDQFCHWSEYLWQDYQGCYFDLETGKYVYKPPAGIGED